MRLRKRRRSLRTDEIRKTIRHNLATFEWARRLAIHHPYAELGDDRVHALMPTARIKWVHWANELAGCPVHGAEIRTRGLSPWKCWLIDPVNHPYKLQCPVGGERYPSNDYAAGDLTSGAFPDDGTGLVREGRRYYMLGEYCHRAYVDHVEPGMSALAGMYEQTGRLDCARKAALILYRIAEEYPNSTDRRDRCFDASYGVYSGMLTDRIWSSETLCSDAIAYDAIFDALDEDPGIVGVIRHRNPQIDSPDAYRSYIEENLLLPGIQAHFDMAICHNVGVVQRTLTTVACVLEDFSDMHPNSRDIIRWLYDRGPGPERYFFANIIQKDGSSFESPGYDASCRSDILMAGVMMEHLRRMHPTELPRTEFPDFLHQPRLREFIRHHSAMICQDRFPVGIGDSGGDTIVPQKDRPLTFSMLPPPTIDLVYRELEDPSLAPALIAADGSVFHSLDREPLDEKIRTDAKAVLASEEKRSELRDGYKVAILRRGRGDHEGAVVLFYGAPRTHGHNDPLNLGLYARGQDLMPELGYPISWKLGAAWESNILSHNTAAVDRKDPERHHHWGCKLDAGTVNAFVVAGRIQLVDARADPYRITSYREEDDREEQPSYHRPTDGRPTPTVDTYRRLVMLVDVSEEDFYVVDLFMIRGGLQHHLAIHGPQSRVRISGVRLGAQAGGTLGDPTGGFGKPYVDDLGVSCLDPFSMISNVRSGRLDGTASLAYSTGLSMGAGVRFLVLPEDGTTLAVGDGRPPAGPELYKVTMAYLWRSSVESQSSQFVARTGQNRLSSQFVTIIEPRGARAFIRGARRLETRTEGTGDFAPVAVGVNRKGSLDIILMQPGQGGRTVEAEGFSTDAAYAVATLRAGRPRTLTVCGGTFARMKGLSISLSEGCLHGRISALDRTKRRVKVTGFPSGLNAVGQRIRFHNRRRSAMYTIVWASPLPGGEWEFTVDFDSLIGAGRVTGVADGILRSHGQMPFSGLVARADGTFVDRYSQYAGATIENARGQGAFWIRGITGIISNDNRPHDIHVDRELHPEANEVFLREHYTEGDEFFVYDYGIGDLAELVNWARATKSGSGWEIASVGRADLIVG